ncbi:MAG TPA: M23 family metallopeptidase [Rhizomicrobium sp.]
MIVRRRFLAGALSLAAMPRLARADAQRLALSGSMEQGGLAIGKTDTAARVTVDDSAVHLSQDGNFAFGFAFDRTTPAHIRVDYADGTNETRDVSPAARTYETQSITGVPEQYVSPPPEVLARIAHENQLIVAARTHDTDENWFANGLDWPTTGIISSVFGSRRILNGKPMAPHLGVDIAAPEGTPIRAPANAIVAIADDYYLDGGFTLLDHGRGVFTCYLHQSKRLVKAGDTVTRGQQIGAVGKTGRATGPHLHWGLNWFQVKLDPSLSTATLAPSKS